MLITHYGCPGSVLGRPCVLFDILAVIEDIQLSRGEVVCHPKTFLSEIHSESHNSN